MPLRASVTPSLLFLHPTQRGGDVLGHRGERFSQTPEFL